MDLGEVSSCALFGAGRDKDAYFDVVADGLRIFTLALVSNAEFCRGTISDCADVAAVFAIRKERQRIERNVRKRMMSNSARWRVRKAVRYHERDYL